MSSRGESGDIDETAWIKAYADLMGVSESAARSVYMYVLCTDTAKSEPESAPGRNDSSTAIPIESNGT